LLRHLQEIVDVKPFRWLPAIVLPAVAAACSGGGSVQSVPLAVESVQRADAHTASPDIHIGPTPAPTPFQRYQLRYSFGSSSGDGVNPEGNLLAEGLSLYGTTNAGGKNGKGTVYYYPLSSQDSVIANFPESGFNSANPQSGLIAGGKNQTGGTNLYGISAAGGYSGGGTLYEIELGGTVLYPARPDGVVMSFGAGSVPQGGLLYQSGALLGVTEAGGLGNGTLFSVVNGVVSILYEFKGGSDGAAPNGGLVALNGSIYGTTHGGGVSGAGTVFAYNMGTQKETVLHSFGSGQDGTHPLAGLVALNGELYGTTHGGGAKGVGTVFEISPSGAESVLHSFAGYPTDGSQPASTLVASGNGLYGTTTAGGTVAATNSGTVFGITTSGSESVLHSFGGSGDGSTPLGGVVAIDLLFPYLFGTTSAGGAHGDGTIFSYCIASSSCI
jgi:uncharacterized repeat protein (TIGR03803 family)